MDAMTPDVVAESAVPVESPEITKIAALAPRVEQFTNDAIDSVVERLTAYRDVSARGSVPVLRRLLRKEGVDPKIAGVIILRHAIDAFVMGHSLTNAGSKVGKSIASLAGEKIAKGRAITAGIEALDMVGEASGAFEITAEMADRPSKKEGGISVVLGYRLVPKSGSLMAALIEAGKVGSPTVVVGGAAPWTSLADGGIPTQTGGMIHASPVHLGDCTPETAPRLYDAINALQSMRYRVNPVAMEVIQAHDNAKAAAWLAAKYVAAGMDPEAAKRKAQSLARL